MLRLFSSRERVLARLVQSAQRASAAADKHRWAPDAVEIAHGRVAEASSKVDTLASTA